MLKLVVKKILTVLHWIFFYLGLTCLIENACLQPECCAGTSIREVAQFDPIALHI